MRERLAGLLIKLADRIESLAYRIDSLPAYEPTPGDLRFPVLTRLPLAEFTEQGVFTWTAGPDVDEMVISAVKRSLQVHSQPDTSEDAA